MGQTTVRNLWSATQNSSHSNQFLNYANLYFDRPRSPCTVVSVKPLAVNPGPKRYARDDDAGAATIRKRYIKVMPVPRFTLRSSNSKRWPSRALELKTAGAGLTVRVATVIVTLLTKLFTTVVNCAPLWALVMAGAVYVVLSRR
jgi:hypothetical protein